jgi:two-component system NtrC family response regulator
MIDPVILVADDEKIQRESLAGFLRKNGYQTLTAKSAEEAYTISAEQTIDIVLTDFKMSGKSGFELLKDLKRLNPEITVILMTAFGRIEDAVAAMKAGAFDYLTKPIDLDELEELLKRALQLKQLANENRLLRQSLREKHSFTNIISNCAVMEETLNLAARSASSKTSVLIQGESGTGKELIARAIHFASPRNQKAMITVNCSAIPENLLESELFGYEKGAFTGAVNAKSGRVEEADGSTLFLDEVGDIPQSVQVKLLRFLQFGEFQRVGSNRLQKVDARLISATNRDLQKMIRANQFRDDFYYRLNVINIHVPPLRRRKEDIPLLIDYFIRKFAGQNQKDIRQISREAMDTLLKYDFPGNVRELENLIERAVVLARREVITTADLPIPVSSIPQPEATGSAAPLEYYPGSFKDKIEAFEKDLLQRALEQFNYNQSRAADSIGMTERNLRYKLQKYGLK